MRLVEDGEVSLSTCVSRILPQFSGEGRETIRVWHLLTHTSGLPDMLPNNEALRNAGADLDEFFVNLCSVRPSFRPGSQTRYQSMGFLLLAKIAEEIANQPFPQFVESELLTPTGMEATSLGLMEGSSSDPGLDVDLPMGQVSKPWNWNSRYWRRLGAPWGGLIATAADLAMFINLFLNRGCSAAGRQVLAPATVELMTREVRGGPDPSWGLGWKVRGLGPPVMDEARSAEWGEPFVDEAGIVASPEATFGRAFMGDLVSPLAFGHGGATGCVMWADPVMQLSMVLLTTNQTSLRSGLLGRVSSSVSAAVIKN